MRTVFPSDIAETWLYKDLTGQQIRDVANYQLASGGMIATPFDRDLLKKKNPHQKTAYKEASELVYN